MLELSRTTTFRHLVETSLDGGPADHSISRLTDANPGDDAPLQLAGSPSDIRLGRRRAQEGVESGPGARSLR